MRAVSTAFLVLVAVIAMAQGPAAPAPEYDSTVEVTVRGEVQQIHESKVATDHPGLHILLKTEAETVEVHTCPVPFLREVEFTIEVGNRVTVVGSRPAGGPVIVAREIRKGQESLVLRDAKGAPNWIRR
jgi:hypothetical protein